jgi:hypothetical protein
MQLLMRTAILSLDFDNVKSNEGSSDTPVCLVYLQDFSWRQWHARSVDQRGLVPAEHEFI